jgi:hypothetical protein
MLLTDDDDDDRCLLDVKIAWIEIRFEVCVGVQFCAMLDLSLSAVRPFRWIFLIPNQHGIREKAFVFINLVSGQRSVVSRQATIALFMMCRRNL